MSTTYGYIRVSTARQHDDRQWVAMNDYGVPQENVFVDKQSGKDFNRPAYIKLKNCVKNGDKIVIKSLDRLGRNFDEIIEEWRILTNVKEITIIILDMPFLHDLQKFDLLGKTIAGIMLYLMSYFAQMERECILARQKEGIEAAKARGVKFGRKLKQPSQDFPAILAKWQAKEISAAQAARELGVNIRTFKRWIKI